MKGCLTILPIYRIRLIEIKTFYYFYISLLLCLILSVSMVFIWFMGVQQQASQTINEIDLLPTIYFFDKTHQTITQPSLKIFDTFIGATYKSCSGIGNQMFRFASLYSIGQSLNRTPFYDSTKLCQNEAMEEFYHVFLNLFNLIKPRSIEANDSTQMDYGLNCCKYENPNKIKNVNEKYLILNGNYFQSYKYFDKFKNEILKLFEFKEDLRLKIDKAAKKLFIDDTSHKMCVYIRRGDFLISKQLETRADFLIPAMDFMQADLRKTNASKPLSLIFLGETQNFVETLNFNKTLYQQIYSPSLQTRGEDMYFGSKFCDSFLLSASGSTFGWWMAYFLPNKTQIFYNGIVGKFGIHRKDAFDFDQFPETWNRLLLDEKTGKVLLENQWFYQRHGWTKGYEPNNIY